MAELNDFDRGLLLGVLIGSGSFGGDGRQPQVTVRMHTRHEALFQWLITTFPRSRLYGPYHHGERSYYQWMARGPVLVEDVLPVIEGSLDGALDGHAMARFQAMTANYAGYIARARSRAGLE